jgi:hypothetical protein
MHANPYYEYGVLCDFELRLNIFEALSLCDTTSCADMQCATESQIKSQLFAACIQHTPTPRAAVAGARR